MDNICSPPTGSFSGSPTFVLSQSNQRSTRTRKVEDCNVLCNRRRSLRLMTKFSAHHSINQLPAPAPKKASKKRSKRPGHEDKEKVSNYRLRMVGRVKLDVSQLRPYMRSVIYGCAELVIQNHSLEHNQNWRDWHILDIVEATRLQNLYSVTFQAEIADDDKGLSRKTTFQGHLWSGHSSRMVQGIRTLKPCCTKWYRGKLWIPLTRPPPEPKDPVAYPFSRSVLEEEEKATIEFIEALKSRILCNRTDPLVPVERHGSDSRFSYNLLSNKRARKTPVEKPKKTDEEEGIIINLELGKLSESDIASLNGCATLAMQDHLIQTHYAEFREWELVEIEEASREGLGGVAGYIYHLTFRACHGDDVRTLEAEVWDGMGQRRVNRCRVRAPRTTDWYPGDLWIAI
ncbi:hypothetical protein OROMI_025272 [Orobanche minor]